MQLSKPVVYWVILIVFLLVIFPIGYFLKPERFIEGYWKVLLIMYIIITIGYYFLFVHFR